MTKTFALYGNIIYTPTKDKLVIKNNHYLVCCDGKVEGIYQKLPAELENIEVLAYDNKLIIPGLCDTHVHAPQYSFRGIGMDYQLIQWLDTFTFPEEMQYSDVNYAKESYKIFADDLKNSATTRASIFATSHIDSTIELMELLEKTGVKCFVGKVNMDRNCPEQLQEKEPLEAAAMTEQWILESREKFTNIKPILTPRFIPSCTDELLEEIGKLAKKYELPVQSHLSENTGEISWVKELCPWAETYSMAYDKFNLFGNVSPTVMAHCVHSNETEQEHIKNNGVIVSHCPSSNANLSSGIAPIKKYLKNGINVSLGTDIGAGYDLSVLRAMADAIQMSKVRTCFCDDEEQALTLSEAFYIGTKGGAPLFGKVGSFEKNYEFDAVVIDDSVIKSNMIMDTRNRLERAIYLDKNIDIEAKFVSGNQII